MADFVRGDCHKCKYETSAECVPRSQKMGFPKCYQSIVTNYDCIISKTPEELADFVAKALYGMLGGQPRLVGEGFEDCKNRWFNWLRQEVK